MKEVVCGVCESDPHVFCYACQGDPVTWNILILYVVICGGRHPKAFFLGLREFRRDFTTSFIGETNEIDKYDAYDTGRELMHRITRRKYDH